MFGAIDQNPQAAPNVSFRPKADLQLMARFGFTDLHSFKDFVVYVQTYLPNRFPPREAASPKEQWSMELAFEGLREGLKLARSEKGPKPVFADCENLVNEAHEQYRIGHEREGFFKL